MPNNIAAWLQFKLYLLTLSGYSADLFTCGGKEEIDDDPQYRWQLAVDMIYRGVHCGLLNVWDGPTQRSDGEKTMALVKELAQFDPNAHDLPMCWVGPEIEATKLCEDLINKYCVQDFENGKVCTPFIKEIEMIFERNGVSWSSVPLIRLGSGIGCYENSASR